MNRWINILTDTPTNRDTNRQTNTYQRHYSRLLIIFNNLVTETKWNKRGRKETLKINTESNKTHQNSTVKSESKASNKKKRKPKKCDLALMQNLGLGEYVRKKNY